MVWVGRDLTAHPVQPLPRAPQTVHFKPVTLTLLSILPVTLGEDALELGPCLAAASVDMVSMSLHVSVCPCGHVSVGLYGHVSVVSLCPCVPVSMCPCAAASPGWGTRVFLCWEQSERRVLPQPGRQAAAERSRNKSQLSRKIGLHFPSSWWKARGFLWQLVFSAVRPY